MPKMTLQIDGKKHDVDVPLDQPLLYTLTDLIKLSDHVLHPQVL